jgi:ubiquitin-protein ligase
LRQSLAPYRGTEPDEHANPDMIGRAAILEALMAFTTNATITVSDFVEETARHAGLLSSTRRDPEVSTGSDRGVFHQYYDRLEAVIIERLSQLAASLPAIAVARGVVGLGSPTSERETVQTASAPLPEAVVDAVAAAAASGSPAPTTTSSDSMQHEQDTSDIATSKSAFPRETSGSDEVLVPSLPTTTADLGVSAPSTKPVSASTVAHARHEEPADPHADMDRFAMVDTLHQHFYESGSSSDSASSPAAAGFPAVVRKEWNRLARHLPPGIFVHGSEARLDFLRAAIIGPADTPYADIVFFFDFSLPPDYPATPPKVHFMSHGRRLNPNLYEDGKVCLSILGTWDGEGVEKWDPRNSNVLRVLLSLQAMVFVEEPYYNEAGYEKQAGTSEGIANSRLYNESTLLLSLRHIVSSLRPGGAPQDFADLTRSHYRAVGDRIGARCRNLLRDKATDGPSPESPVSSTDLDAYGSVGFKRSLEGLLPRVETAMAGDSQGADVGSDI